MAVEPHQEGKIAPWQGISAKSRLMQHIFSGGASFHRCYRRDFLNRSCACKYSNFKGNCTDSAPRSCRSLGVVTGIFTQFDWSHYEDRPRVAFFILSDQTMHGSDILYPLVRVWMLLLILNRVADKPLKEMSELFSFTIIIGFSLRASCIHFSEAAKPTWVKLFFVCVICLFK